MKFNISIIKKAAAASAFMMAALVFAQEIPEDISPELMVEPEQTEKTTGIDPELQKNFVIVMNSHNYNLNPATANYSAEAQILTGLYEGLFTYDPITLDPLYAMAKSYRVSRDKKRWTFILRDDLKFSDGVEITAEDVKNSWINMIADPRAPYSSLFDIVKGARNFRIGKGVPQEVAIQVVDQYTISVSLEQPASHLPKLLCMPAFSVTGNDLNLFTGPFVIASRTSDYLVLKKNENYYDKEHTNLEQITILFSSEADENTFAYNTGSIDWIAASFNEKMLLSKDSIHLCAEFATQYLFFKFREGSLFNKADLRHALLEAVPWTELRANTYVQADTLVYALNGYPKVEGYVFTDPLEAKLLMKQARSELEIPEDQKITIKFAISDSEYMRKKAQLLKEAWEPLGIALETEEYGEYEYLGNIETSDADLFSYTWIGDFADPLAFLELFRGNSTMNVTNWNNPEFDRLLDEAALYNDENHNKLLAKAEQILLDDGVILPIQHPVSLNIINLNGIGGWAVNSFDIHPLKYLFKRETKDFIPNIVMLTE